MIALQSVSKRYGSKTVIHDMSFSVAEGEIVGLLGPNGAGKTTTLRMLAGYTAATAGRVTVNGCDMVSRNVEAARVIGYLPERPPLYDTLSVTAYLRFVARAKGVARASLAGELDRVITACRLVPVSGREIGQLSKGFRQRLGLAQALLGEPRVLLLDEPTAGLDPAQIHEARELIRSFGRDHTVLLSTHILHEVTLICSRVAIIDHGRLLAIDTPDGLERALQASNAVALRVSAPGAPLRAALEAVDGVREIEIAPVPGEAGTLAVLCRLDERADLVPQIARAVAGRWALHHLERRQPTLENIFLHYVSRGGAGAEAA